MANPKFSADIEDVLGDPPKRGPGRPPGSGSGKDRGRVANPYRDALYQQQERLARIKADTLSAKLVEASTVAVEWASVLREVRAALLAVPSRVRGRLPHLSPADMEVIDTEVRAALTSLADAVEGDSP